MKFLIRLYMLSTLEGGRKSTAKEHYRPDWKWEGSDMLCCAQILSDVSPGETKELIIEPLVSDNWCDVSIGTQLTVQEGPKVVGHGEVLEVL